MFDDAGSVGHIFCFGRFRLSPQKRVLLRDSIPVPLGSRAFDILIQLVERHGELVSNEELIARTWPKTIVVQANLAVQMNGLRRALGDDHRGERYILNEPGRGYRFVADVADEPEPEPKPAENERAVIAEMVEIGIRALELARVALSGAVAQEETQSQDQDAEIRSILHENHHRQRDAA